MEDKGKSLGKRWKNISMGCVSSLTVANSDQMHILGRRGCLTPSLLHIHPPEGLVHVCNKSSGILCLPDASKGNLPTPPSSTQTSPTPTPSTSNSASNPSSSPPGLTTPPRQSPCPTSPTRDIQYLPPARGFLKEARYKETRVLAPESERAEENGGTQFKRHNRISGTSAVVGFLAGLMPNNAANSHSRPAS